ncbi:MAG TPA: exodeoxyribonuclease I [Patescibacteria group bacterium]|jgi:exodeoxyribonuclease-1|nr:exodeoxyribonuclease I [Patescibacteria group bacterium]
MVKTTSSSFFFYDLETSGFNPREARVLQFAGRRTTLDLEPIGQPLSRYIALTPDIIPDPTAIIVNGITPQITLDKGISEFDFTAIFNLDIATPGTIFVGYNNIRFDDEFIRFMLYRNFYDPYQWQWKNSRSRWDLLDVVRMTRALRPANISWPFDTKGQSSNRLELLAAVNNLEHLHAHEALSDVDATIALARLIKTNQPKLFGYLLSVRDKKAVEKVVRSGQPFLYTSGKYKSEFEKTTIVQSLGPHPSHQGDLVYDLRFDPSPLARLEAPELADLWRWQPDKQSRQLPVKTLQFNRCPAIAPLSVLDDASQTRLKLDLDEINHNLANLKKIKHWPERLHQALAILDQQRQSQLLTSDNEVDSQLYDGFISDNDRDKLSRIRRTPPSGLKAGDIFADQRLNQLLPLYKARNFPSSLTPDEQQNWQAYLRQRLSGGGASGRLNNFKVQIKQAGQQKGLTTPQKHILKDLEDYRLRVQSIVADESESKTRTPKRSSS